MKKRFILLLFLGYFTSSFASKVDTLVVMSQSMNKNIKNVVIIPDTYDSQEATYDVLYLLHGAGGYYGSWLIVAPQIRAYADTYNMIIVCPDGGLTSWYFDSPVDASIRYETYVSKELIAVIDSKYHTKTKPDGRAITGLSMGGHGAFYLAFRHQDIWGAAGSTSGGVDIRPFPKNWDLPKRLGSYKKHPDNWEQNTVANMVGLLNKGNLKLIFDCGVDDFFYEVNSKLHQQLLNMHYPHDYIERPGGHTIEYWRNAIKYQMLFFDDFFRNN